MKKIISIFLFCVFCYNSFFQNSITEKKEAGAFPLVSSAVTKIYVDENEDWLVNKAVSLFQGDIQKVTGRLPEIIHALPSVEKNIIIVGSLKSLINQLILQKKTTCWFKR